jgi:hypothetical protein
VPLLMLFNRHNIFSLSIAMVSIVAIVTVVHQFIMLPLLDISM